MIVCDYFIGFLVIEEWENEKKQGKRRHGRRWWRKSAAAVEAGRVAATSGQGSASQHFLLHYQSSSLAWVSLALCVDNCILRFLHISYLVALFCSFLVHFIQLWILFETDPSSMKPIWFFVVPVPFFHASEPNFGFGNSHLSCQIWHLIWQLPNFGTSFDFALEWSFWGELPNFSFGNSFSFSIGDALRLHWFWASTHKENVA